MFNFDRTIYLADTDSAGVVYFINVMQFCHEAYEHWLANNGINLHQLITEREYALPIVNCEVKFLKPIFLGDKININLEVLDIGNCSFSIAYKIVKLNNPDKIIAEAQTRHVCINPQTRNKIKLPEFILNLLENKI